MTRHVVDRYVWRGTSGKPPEYRMDINVSSIPKYAPRITMLTPPEVGIPAAGSVMDSKKEANNRTRSKSRMQCDYRRYTLTKYRITRLVRCCDMSRDMTRTRCKTSTRTAPSGRPHKRKHHPRWQRDGWIRRWNCSHTNVRVLIWHCSRQRRCKPRRYRRKR
jgi:hypothetical protein